MGKRLKPLITSFLFLLTLLMAAGCQTKTSNQPVEDGLVVLLPRELKAVLVDPDTQQVVSEYDLGRPAFDYVVAPNEKVYMPLQGLPNKQNGLVAVLDRKTGKLTEIQSPVPSLDLVAVTSGGTAFVRSLFVTDKGSHILAIDTNTDRVLGTVTMPGMVSQVSPYSESEVLVSVNFPQLGNVYVVDKELGDPSPLFPAPLEPWAPNTIILKPGTSTAYFLYCGLSKAATERRAVVTSYISDPKLLEPHVEVWDLQTRKMTKRIFLTVPSPQNMVLGPDGMLYLSHIGMDGTPVRQISILDPDSGVIKTHETVLDPSTLAIQSGKVYVASNREHIVDVLDLNGLSRITQVQLEAVPTVGKQSY